MFDVLNLTIPFFGVIALGAFSRAISFFEEDMGVKLARFAFYFILPPFFFLAITAAPVDKLMNIGFIIRYEAATFLVLVSSAIISSYLFGLRGIERGLFGLNAAYPNVGYIGFPLCIMAFGNEAALPLAMILAIDTIVLLVLTACFMSTDREGAFFASLRHTSLQLVKNPLIVSAFIGIGWAYLGLPVPLLADRFMTMLAGAAAPSALFALGITLWGSDIKGAKAELGYMVWAKLFIHPALIAFFFIALPGMDKIWIQTAILSASLPIAANVFAMSQYYGVYTQRTASAIMLSTVIASITTPAVLYLLYRFVA